MSVCPLERGSPGALPSSSKRWCWTRWMSAPSPARLLWPGGCAPCSGRPCSTKESWWVSSMSDSLSDRQFGPEEAELLELAAGRLAGGVRARTLAGEQEAAELLERSLRPSALPHVKGLSLAARYIPAERAVGGDWYDLFALPSGEVWLVTGDVAGHGLQGATVMGRTRSTMRAYALLGAPPDEVLSLTSRKLAHFEPGVMVTAVCATSRPPFDDFLVCSAGHLPPVLAVPGELANFVGVPPGPPLGVLPNAVRSSMAVPVPEGAVMVLYTDGLVERRGEVIDTGLELLRSSVTTGHPQAVCAAVVERLLGPKPPSDDVALVAVRKTGPRGSSRRPRSAIRTGHANDSDDDSPTGRFMPHATRSRY